MSTNHMDKVVNEAQRGRVQEFKIIDFTLSSPMDLTKSKDCNKDLTCDFLI